MAYAPKERGKLNGKTIIFIIVAALLAVSFGMHSVLQKKEEKEKFTVCSLTHDKSKQVLEKQYNDTYSIRDYLFYGESLNLYHDTYHVETTDDLAGKSVILKDICSDKEYSYVIRGTIDAQIVLSNITAGYYEVFVVENLIEKRVIFNGTLNDEIISVNRNGSRMNINVLADTDYFKDRGIHVNEEKNYMYIVAKKAKTDDEIYDIAIDPAANDRDFTYQLNKGVEANGFIEAEQTYQAALALKEKLEAKGLKVLLLRDEQEEINSYGEDGRLHRAYKAKAKYYIKLRFEESKADYSGMDITYSAHANGSFSKQVIYYLSRNSAVNISSVYNINDPGNVKCTLYKSDIDGRVVYDSDLVIREAGGKATQAGMYSENAQEGTAFFAKDNVHGMNAVNINLGYLSNSSDVDYWVNHQDEYINALSEGIASYLNLEE